MLLIINIFRPRNSFIIKLALLLAFICIALAFTFLVIKDFSIPIIGVGDVSQYEHTGFYVEQNLTFTPLPKLNFVNNQVFYPYGTNGVFQSFGLERDLFFAILHSSLGIGPWLQIYYLLATLITAVGTFALLVRDYGFVRATGAGLIVTFFNLYTISRYPYQMNLAVCHWTTLSFVADFLIVKKFVLKQHISLWLILVRGCLLILSLSQDLGYIAGYGLTSFTVSIIFITILLVYRYCTRQIRLNSLFFNRAIATYKQEFFTYPRIAILLVCLMIVFGYIYVPLVLQISREAKSFDLSGARAGFSFWTNPLRLLIPLFPKFNPGLPFEKVLFDTPDGGSTGWFLLIIAILGIWQSRRQITIFIPLIITFILCLLFNPIFFPTLKIFPWFVLNRVGGRSTSVYPVILCLFALSINLNGLRSRARNLVCALLVCLACIELFTIYSSLEYQPYYPDKNFFTYMNYVKKQSGEAVLDWPFCIAGGNDMGDGASTCPYDNVEVPALRRFHEKKVMGHYFGRLHPSQTMPYLIAGWEKLLNNPCFTPSEWSFFTDFYKFNDFVGINLYEELLPKKCANEFYRRFGTPTAETVVPKSGKVKFIPKSLNLKNQVNLSLGNKLRLVPISDLSKSNLLQFNSPPGLISAGLTNIENEKGNNVRWGKEPETTLIFTLSKPQILNLDFKFEDSVVGQEVVIEINQKAVKDISNLQSNSFEERIIFEGIAGDNNITFKYKKEMTLLDFLKDSIHLITSKGTTGINYSNIKNISRRYRYRNAIKFSRLVISAESKPLMKR